MKNKRYLTFLNNGTKGTRMFSTMWSVQIHILFSAVGSSPAKDFAFKSKTFTNSWTRLYPGHEKAQAFVLSGQHTKDIKKKERWVNLQHKQELLKTSSFIEDSTKYPKTDHQETNENLRPSPDMSVENSSSFLSFSLAALNSLNNSEEMPAMLWKMLDTSHVNLKLLETSGQETTHLKSSIVSEIKNPVSGMAHSSFSPPGPSKRFSQFFSGITTSFLLTVFTELGDRTFFITGLLVLELPYILVFWGSWLALVSQTILSTLVGYTFHCLPVSFTSSKYFSFPFDDYAAAVFLLVFGIQHLFKLSQCRFSHKHKVNTLLSQPHTTRSTWSSTQHVTHRESLFHGSSSPWAYQSLSPLDPSLSHSTTSFIDSNSLSQGAESLDVGQHSLTQDIISGSPMSSKVCPPSSLQLLSSSTTIPLVLDSPKENDDEIQQAKKIVKDFQAKTLTESRVGILLKVFWVIFIAEFADKSMFSTIALATTQDPLAVSLGGSAAHFFVTLLATLTGTLCENFISETLTHCIGAVLFLGFAVLTTLEGLNRQGILFWPLLNSMNVLENKFTLHSSATS